MEPTPPTAGHIEGADDWNGLISWNATVERTVHRTDNTTRLKGMPVVATATTGLTQAKYNSVAPKSRAVDSVTKMCWPCGAIELYRRMSMLAMRTTAQHSHEGNVMGHMADAVASSRHTTAMNHAATHAKTTNAACSP
ncbi:hypothetical protein H257_06041 [Aphanomyces astaci]|uniref:Uncharacterized protein n=1 Tax=Aphanomyces astaci TaxID=112090 RepID=W4GQH1_APHAT|nr:hypothetical protein H257_06041 [Aphanomyces astaci]ETV81556.1 hypothetical protein H257_06041 [Aphanomyces astaci]|eukprot:XP_009829414.1 hypothetical protein H257_06041 [Aphanomyces astaci]